jgi:hypothetical protein
VRALLLAGLAACLAIPVSADAVPRAPIGTGDVNGDHRPDVVLSDYGASPLGRRAAGEVEVLFGGRRIALARRKHLGSRGFLIFGALAHDAIGDTATIAGDLNGDGLDDIVVVARSASPQHRRGAGAAWVIFGGRSHADVDLAHLAGRGFEIDGPANTSGDGVFQSASGIGDVNGDGLADLVVGVGGATTGATGAGEAFVVLGRRAPALADLGQPGDWFQRITGTTRNEGLGSYVSGLGDVNGDGLGDVVLDATRPVVLYGSRGPGELSASALGSRGFAISGLDRSSTHDVAAAGDVNRDGHADVLLGDVYTGSGETGPGALYVLRGSQRRRSGVSVDHLGGAGLAIAPHHRDGLFGDGIAGVGDFSGDRRPDVCSGSLGTGEVDVDFQASDTGRRKPHGLQVRVPGQANEVGSPNLFCRPAGDVNGDGRADVVIEENELPINRFFLVYGGHGGTLDVRHLGARGHELR